MLAASCLVTGSPDFAEPEETPPVLLPETASPDPRQLLVIEGEPKTFQAMLRSRDVADGVEVRLLIDYGVPKPDRNYQPYQYYFSAFTDLDPSPDAELLRQVTADWRPSDSPGLAPGCHTFTLMVSHRFDSRSGCPEELSDSSSITWFAWVCDGADCNAETFDPRSSCPEVVARCPETPDASGISSSTGAP
jgi:hypothetical protein